MKAKSDAQSRAPVQTSAGRLIVVTGRTAIGLNSEMTLDEFLSDLLIRKLMASDRVDMVAFRKTAGESAIG
jgi:hypothetical protein